jgi:hypothetical protein
MEHIVHRGGKIVSLTPADEDLQGVKDNIDRTAAELAIQRLREELSELQVKIDALKLPKRRPSKGVGSIGCIISPLSAAVLAIASAWFLSAGVFGEFAPFSPPKYTPSEVEGSLIVLGVLFALLSLCLLIVVPIRLRFQRRKWEEKDALDAQIEQRKAELEEQLLVIGRHENK